MVNALIHADYRGQGGVVVDRFPDRFELSNPGNLLVSIEQLRLGAISECRNPYLQRMFQMMGAGDKADQALTKFGKAGLCKNGVGRSFKNNSNPIEFG